MKSFDTFAPGPKEPYSTETSTVPPAFDPAAPSSSVRRVKPVDEHEHDLTADVSEDAREILRHFPEGEPPARMLLPWGLASIIIVLVAFVAAISVMMGIFISLEAGIMTAALGLMLAVVANPVLWAAVFRVREHRNADRAAPSPKP